MTAVVKIGLQENIARTLVITRREVRDQISDWRILAPIVVHTLVFPPLATLTANQAVNFVEQYGASVVAERLIPFLLMIVGFFSLGVLSSIVVMAPLGFAGYFA